MFYIVVTYLAFSPLLLASYCFSLASLQPFYSSCPWFLPIFRGLVRLLQILRQRCWKLPGNHSMPPSGTRHSRIVKLINPYVSQKATLIMFQLILHTIPLPVLLLPQKSCFFLKPDLLTSLLVLRSNAKNVWLSEPAVCYSSSNI